MSLSIAPTPSFPVPASAVPLGLPLLPPDGRVSPLVIADHLITLAEHADRAGFQVTASNLVKLVFTVLDEHGLPN